MKAGGTVKSGASAAPRAGVARPREVSRPRRPASATSDPVREIPQRVLRNDISRILAEVAAGATFRVTVRGRAVAELVPVSERRTWVQLTVLERIIREHPLDERFMRDVDGAVDQTIEDAWTES